MNYSRSPGSLKNYGLTKYGRVLSAIIINVVLITAIAGKVFSPVTFFSWLLEVVKLHDISSYAVFDYVKINVVLISLLVLLLFVEIAVILSCFRGFYSFFVASSFFFSTMLLVSLFAYSQDLSGDCGCFGSIIVIENTVSKIILNFLLTVVSVVNVFLLKSKS